MGLVGNLPLPPGQLAGIATGWVLDRVHPLRLGGPPILHRVGGAALMVTGCWMAVAALRERRRAEPGPFDLERPAVLVTAGPYALTRHPMYVGWWLIHLGAGLARSSAWVLLTVPAAVLAEHRAVVGEESVLAERFGRDYAAYAARVGRYLPHLTRHADAR